MQRKQGSLINGERDLQYLYKDVCCSWPTRSVLANVGMTSLRRQEWKAYFLHTNHVSITWKISQMISLQRKHWNIMIYSAPDRSSLELLIHSGRKQCAFCPLMMGQYWKYHSNSACKLGLDLKCSFSSVQGQIWFDAIDSIRFSVFQDLQASKRVGTNPKSLI